MAAYPSFAQLLTSGDVWQDDLKMDRAVDGTAMVRAFYPGRKHQFAVRHTLVSADLTTFLAFYDANRTLEVDFTWAADGNVYSCLFAGNGVKLSYPAPGLTNVEVTLVEI